MDASWEPASSFTQGGEKILKEYQERHSIF